MTYEEQKAITKQAEKLFNRYCSHNNPDLFCSEECPFSQMCNDKQLHWGCGVWEELMGEDL